MLVGRLTTALRCQVCKIYVRLVADRSALVGVNDILCNPKVNHPSILHGCDNVTWRKSGTLCDTACMLEIS